jgi:hypothetical protein
LPSASRKKNCAGTVGEVDALLEPELLDVERERSVLVGDRDEHGSNLRDTGRGCGVGHARLPSRDCDSKG